MNEFKSDKIDESGQELSARTRLGDQLRTARETLGYSHEDVASHIRIRPALLKALETGNYDHFSSVVYIKGFIKTYADFLRIPSEPLLVLYEIEPHEKKRNPIFESIGSSSSYKGPGRKVVFGLSLCAILVMFATLDLSKSNHQIEHFELPEQMNMVSTEENAAANQQHSPEFSSSIIKEDVSEMEPQLFGDPKLYLIELPRTNNPILRPEKITLTPQKEGWVELYNGETLLLRTRLSSSQSYFLLKSEVTMLLIKEGDWLKIQTPEKDLLLNKSTNCHDFYCDLTG